MLRFVVVYRLPTFDSRFVVVGYVTFPRLRPPFTRCCGGYVVCVTRVVRYVTLLRCSLLFPRLPVILVRLRLRYVAFAFTVAFYCWLPRLLRLRLRLRTLLRYVRFTFVFTRLRCYVVSFVVRSVYPVSLFGCCRVRSPALRFALFAFIAAVVAAVTFTVTLLRCVGFRCVAFDLHARCGYITACVCVLRAFTYVTHYVYVTLHVPHLRSHTRLLPVARSRVIYVPFVDLIPLALPVVLRLHVGLSVVPLRYVVTLHLRSRGYPVYAVFPLLHGWLFTFTLRLVTQLPPGYGCTTRWLFTVVTLFAHLRLVVPGYLHTV